MSPLVVALSGVAGLLLGSFITVVIDRVPRGASVVQPGSACGGCGVRLGVVDLVPIASWIALRGRCRRCAASIGWEPIVVELAAVAASVAVAIRFREQPWAVAAHVVLAGALVAQTAIDLRTRRLPREVTYTAIALGLPLLVVAALVGGTPERIAMALGGAALATLMMGLIHVAARGGMGAGDVRFAPLLGLYLGWQNPGLVPIGLFLAFALGSVGGLAYMAVTGFRRRAAVPFGPFMACGAFVAMFVGQDILDVILAR